jgi:hypothetical protein
MEVIGLVGKRGYHQDDCDLRIRSLSKAVRQDGESTNYSTHSDPCAIRKRPRLSQTTLILRVNIPATPSSRMCIHTILLGDNPVRTGSCHVIRSQPRRISRLRLERRNHLPRPIRPRIILVVLTPSKT